LDSFTIELKPRLNLQSEKPDELFLEALSELTRLKGKKLLVLDDVKESEANQEIIDKILALKNSGYKILITSREEIDNIASYNLDVLSKDDAKALFNSIYKIENESLLEEILEYLGYHAFFIEKTALSIKKTLTPQMIIDKFKSGAFSKISVKRKQNFNKFLGQLFSFDELDDEEILILKQFSTLPSIEISFEDLEYLFQKQKDSEFEGLLDFLVAKGWLTKLEENYKLHQIIKEYIVTNHTPSFEEIEVVVNSFNTLIDNSANAQVAVDNRENIIYFESLVALLNRLEIVNEAMGDFFERLGNIYRYLGFYPIAEQLLLKALNIREKLLGEEYFDTATSYNNLANLYYNMEEYKKAEPLYLKSLIIKEKILGEKHPSIATSYNNLAELYRSIGKYQKAEHLYLKALKIWGKVLGEEHPNTALSYNNLAVFYKNIGEYQKAEPFYLKALKIKEKILGEEHPDTATSYNNLAGFYYKKEEFEKAYPYAKKAFYAWSKVLPSDHPNLTNAKNGLAMIEERRG